MYRPNRYCWISTAGSPSGGSDLPWVRSNQGRPKRIGWPGLFAGDGGGGTHGARRRAAAESPEFTHPALRGSIRPGLGSGSLPAVCARHWWTGLWWSEAALARRRAALCGRERATAYTSRSKRGSGLKRSSPGLDSGWNGARGSTAASPAAKLGGARWVVAGVELWPSNSP